MYDHERSLVKKYAGKPFALLGVNSDADLGSIRKIVKDKSLTWRSFWNGPDGTGGPISAGYGISGWPTVYIIDAEGVIREKNPHRGDDYDAIDTAIDELLAEIEKKSDKKDEDVGGAD